MGSIIAFLNSIFGNSPEAQDIGESISDTTEEVIDNTPGFLEDAETVLTAAGSGQQGMSPGDMMIGEGGTTGNLGTGGNNLNTYLNEAGEIVDDLGNIYDAYGNIITKDVDEPKDSNRNKFRKMSPYFFTKGEDDSSNLLGLINNLLVPKKMKMGGAISSPSLSLGRRVYNMPKKKKTVMQTSTKGMPMRGMQSGVPMMKQGGMTKKKYHI
jgi:hypothetical protein